MSTTERMSPVDHLLWLGDNHEDLRSTVVSVAVFEGAPDRNALSERLNSMAVAVNRLRQRVESTGGSIAPPRWEPDPDFDVDNHFRWLPESDTGRTMRDVLDLASEIATTPFPPDRPLWEATAVPAVDGGSFALILKVHHAVTDGINGVRIQLELLDFEPDPDPRTPTGGLDDEAPELRQLDRLCESFKWDLRRRANALARVRDGLGYARREPAAALTKVATTASSLARVGQVTAEPLSKVMTGRTAGRRFDTLSLPLARAKQAGRAAGTKLNAVFMAGLGEGLRLYHEHHQVQQVQLRIGVPLSTRTDDSEANAFVGTRFAMPLMYETLPQYLRTIERLVKTNADEEALEVVPALVAELTRLPTTAATRVFRRLLSGTDAQASNVPGSPLPMYLLGNRLVEQFPFGPTTTSALNVTLLSYVDSLDLGIVTNAGAVPDPEILVDKIRDGFDTVLALADN